MHKKSVHLGGNHLVTAEMPVTDSTADGSLLHKVSSDVLDRTCVLLSRRLGAITQGVWTLVEELKKSRCDDGCTLLCSRSIFCPKLRYLSGKFLLTLG